MEKCLAFLDTVSVINDDGTIHTRVFTKATRTDQYLNINYNHPLEHKRGVVRMLTHRARSIFVDSGERKGELGHVRMALVYIRYPDWMLADTWEEVKEDMREEELTYGVKRDQRRKKRRNPVHQGILQRDKKIFVGFGVLTYFKPSNTRRQLLVHPKDLVGKDKVVGPVYKISCEECEATYVGEIEQSLMASSTTSKVSKHICTIRFRKPNHKITLENTKIFSVENGLNGE